MSEPLARRDLPRVVDLRPTKAFDGKFGAIVTPLKDATYGKYRVYPRADGFFVVVDTTYPRDAFGVPKTDMPVFRSEPDARGWASKNGGAGGDDDADDEEALLEEAGQAGMRARVRGTPRGPIDVSRTCGACGCRAIDDHGVCGRCGWRKP